MSQEHWRIADREFREMVDKAKVRSLLMLYPIGRVALLEASHASKKIQGPEGQSGQVIQRDNS
jgi:hypothetical protein